MATEHVVAVLGDVVGSRRYADRRRLQETMVDAFEKVAAKVSGIQDFRMTVGDEFQAMYATMKDALEAALRLRLHLISAGVKVRIGLGAGEVVKLDDQPDPYGQDGPAWWAARGALQRLSGSEGRSGHPRSSWAVAAGGSKEDLLLAAVVLLEDHLIGRLDTTDADIVLGFLDGQTVTAMAERLGIHKSAVSRRASRNGLRHLVHAQGMVEDV